MFFPSPDQESLNANLIYQGYRNIRKALPLINSGSVFILHLGEILPFSF